MNVAGNRAWCFSQRAPLQNLEKRVNVLSTSCLAISLLPPAYIYMHVYIAIHTHTQNCTQALLLLVFRLQRIAALASSAPRQKSRDSWEIDATAAAGAPAIYENEIPAAAASRLSLAGGRLAGGRVGGDGVDVTRARGENQSGPRDYSSLSLCRCILHTPTEESANLIFLRGCCCCCCCC